MLECWMQVQHDYNTNEVLKRNMYIDSTVPILIYREENTEGLVM